MPDLKELLEKAKRKQAKVLTELESQPKKEPASRLEKAASEEPSRFSKGNRPDRWLRDGKTACGKPIRELRAPDIFGAYKMEKLEAWKSGVRTSEEARGGHFLFTRDFEMAVVSVSTEVFVAYTGKFRVDGETLHLKFETHSKPERVGKSGTRRIVGLDHEALVLEIINPEDSQHITQITWKRMNPELLA